MKRIKITRKTKNVLVFSILLLVPFMFIGGAIAFSPSTSSGESAYIMSGDVIKNFRFDSFDGDTIGLDNMLYNYKLYFETQSVWRLQKDDVVRILAYDVGGTTYLYFKIRMTNNINIFTNVKLNQMSSKAVKVEESFLAGSYEHDAWFDWNDFSWDSYITWYHWDFGDIYNYNWQNNLFQGSLVMSFDISSNLKFGEYTYKQFDYIAVSSAAVVETKHGLMSDDLPEVLIEIPTEYETAEENEKSGGETGGNIKGGFVGIWNPNIDLDNIGMTESFDSGIQPPSDGSSMTPTNKDGTPIWDAKTEGQSMTGCKIRTNIGSLSPVVFEIGGKLSWTEEDIKTKVDLFGKTKLVRDTEIAQTRYGQIALHGWNRYIQIEQEVWFNIWTAVEIEALTDDMEYMKLHTPEEFYNLLIWSSLVDGFGGGRQHTPDPGIDWLGGLFDNIVSIIILIAVIAISILIIVKVVIPYFSRKAKEPTNKDASRYRKLNGYSKGDLNG